jgi:hypothetical protein
MPALPDPAGTGTIMTAASSKTTTGARAAVAVFLAWLLPGAGHLYVGRRTRGLVILLSIAGLFWAGVAMGGVLTVDPHSEPWWYYAQMVTGVHGLVSWQRTLGVYEEVRVALAADETFQKAMSKPAVRRSPQLRRQMEQAFVDRQLARQGRALVAPVDTVARAYAGVAGMLNLMCVFDVLMLCLLGRTAEPAVAPAKTPEGRT